MTELTHNSLPGQAMVLLVLHLQGLFSPACCSSSCSSIGISWLESCLLYDSRLFLSKEALPHILLTPPPHTNVFFLILFCDSKLPCFIDLKIRLFFHLISVPFWGDAHNNYISCLISHDRGQTKVSSGLYFVLKPEKM